MIEIYKIPHMKWLLKSNVNLKYPTILIGLFHLVILVFRIYEIAMDMYLLEELVEINQITYIILIMLLQLLIIISLFVGAGKENHLFLLPWLCFTAPIFVMATSYASLYVAAGDGVQSILNFVFVGLFWISWYTVFKYYIFLRKYNNTTSYTMYKYSQLTGMSKSSSSKTQMFDEDLYVK